MFQMEIPWVVNGEREPERPLRERADPRTEECFHLRGSGINSSQDPGGPYIFFYFQDT